MFAFKELAPIAVLNMPDVFALKAFVPKAVFSRPSVFASNAPLPKAVLLVIAPLPRPTVKPLILASEATSNADVGTFVPIPKRLLISSQNKF